MNNHVIDHLNVELQSTGKGVATPLRAGWAPAPPRAPEARSAGGLRQGRILSGRVRANLTAVGAFLLLIQFASLSHGAVIATNVILRAASFPANTFSPPTGKVFILEHVGFHDNWTSPREIILENTVFNEEGGIVSDITVSYPEKFNTLARTLKMAPTMRIRCADRSSPVQWVVLYGLLVDEGDLYAGIPSMIEGFAKATPGPATGEIRLASARSSLVRLQQSSNLTDWAEVSGAVTASPQGPAVRNFEVSPPPGDPARFFRAAARARETD
jgi:hypothetical protein